MPQSDTKDDGKAAKKKGVKQTVRPCYVWCRIREQWAHRAICLSQQESCCVGCDESYVLYRFRSKRGGPL